MSSTSLPLLGRNDANSQHARRPHLAVRIQQACFPLPPRRPTLSITQQLSSPTYGIEPTPQALLQRLLISTHRFTNKPICAPFTVKTIFSLQNKRRAAFATNAISIPAPAINLTHVAISPVSSLAIDTAFDTLSIRFAFAGQTRQALCTIMR